MSTPAVIYSWMILVVKEALIIPADASSPPSSITGRHPNLFTIMLDTGPEVVKKYVILLHLLL